MFLLCKQLMYEMEKMKSSNQSKDTCQHVILQCKYQDVNLRLKHFIYYIVSYKSTEDFIARRKTKSEKHITKEQSY